MRVNLGVSSIRLLPELYQSALEQIEEMQKENLRLIEEARKHKEKHTCINVTDYKHGQTVSFVVFKEVDL